MTVFADRLARARAAIDREIGGDWIFRPMAQPSGPNAPVVADPARAVVDPIVGLFKEVPAVAFDSNRVASFSPVPSSGSTATLSIIAGDLVVRSKDRFERKSTGLVYSISDPQPQGRGRTTWRLSIVRT